MVLSLSQLRRNIHQEGASFIHWPVHQHRSKVVYTSPHREIQFHSIYNTMVLHSPVV